MRNVIFCTILLAVIALFATCASEGTGGGSSPTEAYKNLFAAVKAKDTEAIKANLSKKTHGLAEMQSGRSGTSIEDVYANGFTETTFASSLPTIRDERVDGNMGAIEVWNTKKSTWEDLPFILEDGSWKLAVGDIFAGNYRSPGKGRAEIEEEAANVMKAPKTGAVNTNSSRPRAVNVPGQPPAANK